MISGWLVFAIVVCVVLCAGCVLAAALLRAAWAQREREALTSGDLRAIEESVVLLIDQLQLEVDQRLAEIEAKRSALQELVKEADERISMLRDLSSGDGTDRPQSVPKESEASGAADTLRMQEVLDLASAGLGCTDIAREAGLGAAEVKLMLRLADSRMN